MQGESLLRVARDRRLAGHVGFWWGFAEGLFFFIVPDVYISFATLFSLRAGGLAWLTSIAGSAVAVAVIGGLMRGLHLDYLGFLDWVPGISPHLILHVDRSLGGDHLPYTPLLILAGVPLKVYSAVALSHGHALAGILVWTLFARVVRIGPPYAAFAVMRLLWRPRIDARPIAWSTMLGLSWLAFYSFYFVRMSRF